MDKKNGDQRLRPLGPAGFNNLHHTGGGTLFLSRKHRHIKALSDTFFYTEFARFWPGVDTFYAPSRRPWISSGITRTRSTPSCWLIFSCTSAVTGPAQSMML